MNRKELDQMQYIEEKIGDDYLKWDNTDIIYRHRQGQQSVKLLIVAVFCNIIK